jgi:hypothetical protein
VQLRAASKLIEFLSSAWFSQSPRADYTAAPSLAFRRQQSGERQHGYPLPVRAFFRPPLGKYPNGIMTIEISPKWTVSPST